jgi:CRP-like cAMP-binding protein
MGVPASPEACKNRILAQLPEKEYLALSADMVRVPTRSRAVLFERDKQIKYVYFPLSGGHSVISQMKDGSAVEVGTIGNEGFSCIDVLTGAGWAAETVICQIPGESLRLPLESFTNAIKGETVLRRLSYQYLQAYLSQISQSVACNRLHSTEERLARWILISHDRVEGNEFHITQEFLAVMLGVHRPSVTVVSKTFQQAGLITYNRGTVTILNRKGLEDACCECYAAVRNKVHHALGVALG